MVTDPDNFLHSLCMFIASQATLQTPAATIAYLETPRTLWRNKIVESSDTAANANTTDPDAVLRIFGGPPARFDPQPRLSIQCATFGTSDIAAMTLARQIYETLLTPPSSLQPGLPLRMKQITAYLTDTNEANGTYMLISVDPGGAPGKVGIDDRGRARVVFNFNVGMVAAFYTDEED